MTYGSGWPGNTPTCKCGKCDTCKHRKYMRKWRRRNRAKVRETGRRWRRTPAGRKSRRAGRKAHYWRHREREIEKSKAAHRKEPGCMRARNKVSEARRSGRLQPQPCEVCGATPADAHHPDHRKPLEVVWLCRPHHAEADGRAKPL